MKRNQFSEEQVIDNLKEAEAGAVVTKLCRKHGMSNVPYSSIAERPTTARTCSKGAS